MTVVYPWRADGPGRATLGVVEDPARARRLAGQCLLSGVAETAVIEQAVTDLGAQTLLGGYFRTGQRWRGRVESGGRVRWRRAVP